jgi:uncharacterized protein YndB with AHSA1/START domain
MGSLNVVVRVSRDLPFSCEASFAAWLEESKARRFFFAAPSGELQRIAIDARVGGAFEVVDRRGDEDVLHTGEYLTLERGRSLAFTFKVPAYSDEASTVTLSFEALAEDRCRVTLDAGAVPAEVHERALQGWSRMLERAEEALRGA